MRAPLLALALLAGAIPQLHAGSLVDVAVEVAGEPVPLYDAVDGSGRLYFEAREGCAYALRLTNRSHERLGALVVVDGLNAISGEREDDRPRAARPPVRARAVGPGRSPRLAHVPRPGAAVHLRRRAMRPTPHARARPTARMGWVEIAVYRDRAPAHFGEWRREQPLSGARDERQAATRLPRRPRASDRSSENAKSARGESGYPGTGWGDAAWDPATEVRFDAAAHPAERTVLRYEYAPALRALGLLPRPWWGRDRLRERDRGEGFARPPRG